MSKKGNGRKRIRRPNKLLYIVVGGLIFLFAKYIKKQRIINKLPKELDTPFIVIGNHSNFYDFIYVITAMYPRRINFVVARKYFHFLVLGGIMKLARAIPKSLSQPDFLATSSIFSVLKNNGIVGIYPEGQIAIQGFTNDSKEVMAKLVKKASVPIVSVRTGGGYFCNPPWAKSSRRGPIESEVDLVLSREDIDSLTVEEIKIRLQNSINIDNHKWQIEKNALYKGKNLAEGLENILYLCPSCHKEFGISTEGNKIKCIYCSLEGEFKEDGHLNWKNENYFHDIGQWHKFQVEGEIKNITNNQEFSISEAVTLAMFKSDKNGIEVVGDGNFTVNDRQYIYEGEINGEFVKLTFEAISISYIPFDAGSNFQIYNKNLLYEFRPINLKWCMKIANICDALLEIEKDKLKEKEVV